MEYLPHLCFAGFNSKRRKLEQERREKRAIAAVFATTEFCVSQQTSKKIEKELGHDNVSFVATQRSKY